MSNTGDAGRDPARDQAADDGVEETALVVDGNAVAGMLAAAFGEDVTAVPGKCAHCGAVAMVAEMKGYVRGPGSVLRCPSCSGVILRVVETEAAILVDARGASYLRFERR